MEIRPTRWVTSEGVFLFQVPEEGSILPIEITMLLSSSLYAISVFFEYEQIKFEEEFMTIVRINFHHPFDTSNISEENDEEQGYVIHSSFKDNICCQSVFLALQINNQLSEFEKAFLDSVVSNLLETLRKEGRNVSDIPFLQNRFIIDETENMLQEIDTKYQSLVASWSLAYGFDCEMSKFDFINVLYNGKIRVEELFYDLGDRAIESFNQLLMSKEEKIILYKIAKSLVSLSSLLYEEEMKELEDKLKFSHSEIILESNQSKKLYRLDVRHYDLDGESFCDITIMSN
ncbi:MAG: hypothetical protein JXA54_05700 [Candidatus Heimdallarchaeota archaeon]|nr:hypothetical protein [Candidatus Heimdallarchaeota archaeon]